MQLYRNSTKTTNPRLKAKQQFSETEIEAKFVRAREEPGGNKKMKKKKRKRRKERRVKRNGEKKQASSALGSTRIFLGEFS